MSNFDVWIMAFAEGADDPAAGLQRVFGVDASTAKMIVGTVPRAVKHNVHAKTAGELRATLESIGAVVECRAAVGAPRTSPRINEPVMKDAVAHFKSSAPPPPLDSMEHTGAAIDPYAVRSQPRAPRLSFDQLNVAPEPRRETQRPPSVAPSSARPSTTDSLLLMAQQRTAKREFQMFTGLAGLGLSMLIIPMFRHASIFQGLAGWGSLVEHSIGLFLLGYGVYEALGVRRETQRLRSGQ